MARIFIDTFESGNHDMWDTENNATVVSSAGLDMDGSYCLDLNDQTEFLHRNITADDEMYFAFLYRVTSDGGARQVIVFYNGSNLVAQVIRLTAKQFSVYRGSTTLADGTKVIDKDTTYLVEIYLKVADSGGRFIVKVDGVTDIDFTGDTKEGAYTQFDGIKLGYKASNWYSYAYFDNFIMDDANWIGDTNHYTITADSGSFTIIGSDVILLHNPFVSTDWKANKGLGPWDFTEQGDKFGYLNNPRWTEDPAAVEFSEDRGYPINDEDDHKPCGHWHKRWGKITIKTIPTGRWVAAQPQLDTPYIYLYDISYKAVIKLKTSIPPIVTEVLPLESLYALGYDRGRGLPGTQKGGYCMNKDGSTLWYLFRDEASGDCQLIEVDISQATMRIMKKTTFAGLLAGQHIEDGCSDDTYTYWCTSLILGRIIKIRNNDHSIIDDHHFNYTIEPCSGDVNDQCIESLDFGGDKLYWAYCRDHVHCSPAYNSCRHLIKSDTDFVEEIDDIICGIGTHAPSWQNLNRVHSGYLLHHRAYHPYHGRLEKRSLSDCSYVFVAYMQYLQNIFGVKGGKLFTLMQVNSLSHPAYLYCLDFSDLSTIFSLNVSYYAGQTQVPTYPWDGTAVSAMSKQTGIIIIVRYHNSEEKNYVASFRADTSLEFLDDTPLDYITQESGNKAEILAEPQIWPM